MSFLRNLLPIFLLLALLAPSAAQAQRANAPELWPSLSAAPAGAKKAREGSKDFVLLVAIEDYIFLDKVVGAKENAADWYTWLTESRGVPSENIALVLNQEATPPDITDKAARLVERSKKMRGGTFWVVYIGHGAPAKPGSGQKGGLLIGVGAQKRPTSFYRESLPLEGLLRQVEAGGQAQTVAVIDACFSGRDTAGRELMEGLQASVMIDAPPVPKNTVVLSAAAANQYAGRLPGAQRPAFSYLVLGGLRGWAGGADNGSGRVSANELVGYANRVLLDLSDVEQTPQVRGQGDLVLTRVGREAGPNLAALKKRLKFGPQQPSSPVPPAPGQVARSEQSAPADSSRSHPDRNIARPNTNAPGAPSAHVQRVAIDGTDAWVMLPPGWMRRTPPDKGMTISFRPQHDDNVTLSMLYYPGSVETQKKFMKAFDMSLINGNFQYIQPQQERTQTGKRWITAEYEMLEKNARVRTLVWNLQRNDGLYMFVAILPSEKAERHHNDFLKILSSLSFN